MAPTDTSCAPIYLCPGTLDIKINPRLGDHEHQEDECESLDRYGKGGLCPVDLGQSFKDDRYHIVYKLGNGGTSTVWMAWDRRSEWVLYSRAI